MRPSARDDEPIDSRDEPPLCADLREKFLAVSVEAAGKTGGWLLVWRLVVAHPWYQAELVDAARTAVCRVAGPDAWRDDAAHDAVLLLARKLRRDPTLGLDRSRTHQFGGWLGRIVRNDCRTAVRRLRRLGRGSRLPPEAELPGRPASSDVEATIDLYLAIGRLPDPARSVLMLVAKGMLIQEAADRLGLSYWKARQAHRDGCGCLRERLDSMRLDSVRD